MKAIVLTYDPNRVFSEHMIRRYEALWPDHPFTFRVPCQTPPAAGGPRREPVPSPPGIQDTMTALLAGLPDDEWVYWALDDKYPIFLAVERVRRIAEWLGSAAAAGVDGVLFCRCRQMLVPSQVRPYGGPRPAGERLLERINFEQIWIHQFLRVKVLRHFFAAFPRDLRLTLGMEAGVALPASYRLLVSAGNLAVFGESTVEGRVTENCRESLLRHGLAPPPNRPVAAGTRIVIGERSRLAFVATLAAKRLPRASWPHLKRLRRALGRGGTGR